MTSWQRLFYTRVDTPPWGSEIMAQYTKTICVRCGKEKRLRKPQKYERILITICPEHGKPTPEDWARVKELKQELAKSGSRF